MANAGKVLVLGLGNDLLADDAVGLHVARAAAASLAGEPGVVVRETMEMGLALLDEIVGFDALVIVDSIQTARAPAGHIHEFDLDALSSRRMSAPHFLGVAETLALGSRLGLAMPRRVRIVAVEVADPFTLAVRMTPQVEQSVDAAAARAGERARGLARQPSPSSAAPVAGA